MMNAFAKFRFLCFFLLLTVAALLLQPAGGYGVGGQLGEIQRLQALEAAIEYVAENAEKPDENDETLRRNRAIVFLFNREINRLALLGKIPDEKYQACQAVFEGMNREFVVNAVRDAGLEAKLQEPKKPKDGKPSRANPGTDTDVIVQHPPSAIKRDILLSDIDKIESNYQGAIREHLKQFDIPWTPAGKIDTDTDFMPHPDHTSPEEFRKINETINMRGGTAYLRPEAARMESDLRPPEGSEIPPLAISRTGEYVAEMRDLFLKKNEYAKQRRADLKKLENDLRELQDEADRLRDNETDPEVSRRMRELRRRISLVENRIDDCEAEAQLAYSQMMKYLERMETAGSKLADQRGLKINPDYLASNWKQALEELKAKGRGPETRDAVEYMALFPMAVLKEHILRYAELLSDIGVKEPAEMEDVKKVLGNLARSNPELAAEIREKLAHALEKDARKKAAEAIPLPGEERFPMEDSAAEALRSICDETRQKRGLSEDEAMRRMRKYKMDISPIDLKKALGTIPGVSRPIIGLDDSLDIAKALDPQAAFELYKNLQMGKDFSMQAQEEVLNFFAKIREGGHHNIIYGNWFSPGWWGGSTLKDRVGPMPPVDSLDALTMRHDFAYQLADQLEEAFQDPALGQQIRAMADIVAVQEALALPHDPANWPHPPQDPEHALRMRALLIYGFTVLAPVRNQYLSEYFQTLQDVGDAATYLKLLHAPLSYKPMELFFERRELAELSEHKQIGIEELRKIVDNRVFQWFMKNGKEEERVRPDGAEILARILDGPGAYIQRDLSRQPKTEPGTVIAGHSGHWVKAYGGWRIEKDPPNHPVEIGPIGVTPGKYLGHISFVPDIPVAMTANNFNTGMTVRHIFRGGTKVVARIGKSAGNKPSGEASREFVIDRPGEIVLTFYVGASHGHAGGYVEHEQSYKATISYLEPVKEEAAEVCAALNEKDVLRVGVKDVTILLADGTITLLRAGSQVRFEKGEEGVPRMVLLAPGSSGHFKTMGTEFERVEVVDPSGQDRRIRPKGTEFIVDREGVEVLDGEVEIIDAGGTTSLAGGERLTFKDGATTVFDVAEREPATSYDGIPLAFDFWSLSPEPYGEKAPPFGRHAADAGWLFADPVIRQARSGVRRSEVEVIDEGAARLTVTHNSYLDDRGNTAPRLLHKITGDFDLEAEVRLEGEGLEWTAVHFLARAPGSYAGALLGHFPGTGANGPGQHYFSGGSGILRTGDGVPCFPALNERKHSRWPEMQSESVRIRLSRRGGVWTSFWSRDGTVWNMSSIIHPDVPETLWVGFCFVNATRASVPAVFTVRDVRLRSAPLNTLPSPEWKTFAMNGAAEAKEDRIHLSLDGGAPGTVRAFRTELLEGDFDVEVAFDAEAWESAPETFRRWTLAAVTQNEVGLGIGCEDSGRGVRYGVLHWNTSEYSPLISMRHDSDPAGKYFSGKLRLARRDGIIHAYYWRSEARGYYRELRLSGQGEGEYAGTLYLRLEVSNGEKAQYAAPLRVAFAVNPSYVAPEEGKRTEIRRDTTLKEDMMIEGSLQHTSGTIDLNGFTLTVTESVYQSGGIMSVNGGRLIVRGDYRIQSVSEEEGKVVYGESDGRLIMKHDDDYVLVEGSFVTHSRSSHHNTLTNGVLEVKGDFAQKETKSNQAAFGASGAHKVVLSGSGRQDVSFESPVRSGFAACSIVNEHVFFSTPCRGWTLDADTVMNAPDGAPHRGFTKTMDLNGKTLTIRGDLLLDDRYDGYAVFKISGGNLVVEGGFLHAAGQMIPGGGSLIVRGDYRIQSVSEEEGNMVYGESTGALFMKHDDDYVLVGGSFVTHSRYSHHNSLTNGVLEVKGDFAQKETKSNQAAFGASGAHKVVLSGSGRQDVSFESPKRSGFQTLIVVNREDREITLSEGGRVGREVFLSLNPLLLELVPGETAGIEVRAPFASERIEWRSFDEKVASVSEGAVRAKAPGRTRIRIASTADESVFLYIPVVVPDKEKPVLNDEAEDTSAGQALVSEEPARERAMKIVHQAIAAQKEGRLEEALRKYKESLLIYNIPNVAEHAEKLEQYIQSMK